MAQLAIRLVSGSFALGLQLAAPFIVFGFAVSAAIGLLARLMPQMQVFFIAMPLNILAGFFLLMLLIGSMMTVFLNYYATEMARFYGLKAHRWPTTQTTPKRQKNQHHEGSRKPPSMATSSRARRSRPSCCWAPARWPSPCSAIPPPKLFARGFRALLEQPDQFSVTGSGVMALMRHALWSLFLILGPPLGLLMAAGLAGQCAAAPARLQRRAPQAGSGQAVADQRASSACSGSRG